MSIIIAFVLMWGLFSIVQEYGKGRSNEKSTPRKRLLTYQTLGNKWPFHDVYSGTVLCVDGNYVIFETSQGTYAINGSAKSKGRKTGEWKSSDEIQIRGKDISPILDAGLLLCK